MTCNYDHRAIQPSFILRAIASSAKIKRLLPKEEVSTPQNENTQHS
jgi:hypothetical protein